MRRIHASTLLIVVSMLGLACEAGPRSGRGLRLPPGDVARGEAAFQALGCVSCHDIFDEPALPRDASSPPIVVLGGEVTRIESHGELVTSIVNPSHRLAARMPKEAVAEGDTSRMPAINDVMTVSQLIDLTEYLQTKYRIRHDTLYLP